MNKRLPFFVKGTIVKGFARGAKQLGFPTANFSEVVTDTLPVDLECGIYFGWARVEGWSVLPMVVSIGYNPFYNNTKKSIETHILHQFDRDLYDLELRICVLAWIRSEKNFTSVEGLVEEIKNDIKVALKELQADKMEAYKDHEYFKDN